MEERTVCYFEIAKIPWQHQEAVSYALKLDMKRVTSNWKGEAQFL
jgi:hypothetical protein